jgi:hypothetical protein
MSVHQETENVPFALGRGYGTSNDIWVVDRVPVARHTDLQQPTSRKLRKNGLCLTQQFLVVKITVIAPHIPNVPLEEVATSFHNLAENTITGEFKQLRRTVLPAR